MIECKYKKEFGAINRGFIVYTCIKNGRLINDTICRKCNNRDPNFKRIKIETDFLRRSDKEIEQLYKICLSCPYFHTESQTCNYMRGEIIPVDVVAQNPANHCPENKW